MYRKPIEDLLKPYNKGKVYPMSVDDFIENAKRYILAVKEERVMCVIDAVSRSGMSRTMKFVEMTSSNYRGRHIILNFFRLFEVLGHEKVKDSDFFRIHGCGMDMVFNTNYNIIHELRSLGFINKKTCAALAQKTPHKL
jgi:hypothetical protein